MPDFEKILNKHINHSMILDRDGVIKAMAECYELGLEHSAIKFNTLKDSFESIIADCFPDSFLDELRREAGLIEIGV